MSSYTLRLILVTLSAQNEKEEVYFARYLKEGFLIAAETKEAVSALLVIPREAFEARLKDAVSEERAFTESEDRVREVWRAVDRLYSPKDGVKIVRFEIVQFSMAETTELPL